VNVETDIKEAIDRRDTNGRDAPFYAMRALESALKIISDEKGWTTGREKGASNYIDNHAMQARRTATTSPIGRPRRSGSCSRRSETLTAMGRAARPRRL